MSNMFIEFQCTYMGVKANFTNILSFLDKNREFEKKCVLIEIVTIFFYRSNDAISIEFHWK